MRSPAPWLAALALAAGACSDGGGGAHGAHSPPPAEAAAPTSQPLVYGTVQVADQAGDGRSVVISRIELNGMAGFVVIHDESQGGPHRVLGHAPVPVGTSRNVVVNLEKPLASGPYWAMLHRDAGRESVFEWPGPDGPVRAPTGTRYAQRRLVLSVDP